MLLHVNLKALRESLSGGNGALLLSWFLMTQSFKTLRVASLTIKTYLLAEFAFSAKVFIVSEATRRFLLMLPSNTSPTITQDQQ